MVTGDRRDVAESIAKQAGVDAFEAEVLPDGKLDVVRQWQQKVGAVGMVGDGINDAPALAAADVGIAIGSGTDVAKETGEIVLIRNDLMDAVRSIIVGRKTLSKVKQNLFWALIYNVIGIPIAAGLFSRYGIILKAEFAGLAMAISSVSVVVNSLLLRRVTRQL
jgi:Cu+-exporting ATPase